MYLFGCCLHLFETMPSTLDRGQQFARDVSCQSWLQLLPWDRFASIQCSVKSGPGFQTKRVRLVSPISRLYLHGLPHRHLQGILGLLAHHQSQGTLELLRLTLRKPDVEGGKRRVVNSGSGATVMTGDTGLSTGPAMSCSMCGMNMCAFVGVHNIPTWTSADCSRIQ